MTGTEGGLGSSRSCKIICTLNGSQIILCHIEQRILGHFSSSFIHCSGVGHGTYGYLERLIGLRCPTTNIYRFVGQNGTNGGGDVILSVATECLRACTECIGDSTAQPADAGINLHEVARERLVWREYTT